jgi:hypothetical protein
MTTAVSPCPDEDGRARGPDAEPGAGPGVRRLPRGGGRDAGGLDGIPPERVIGSAVGLAYRNEDGRSDLLDKSEMDVLDGARAPGWTVVSMKDDWTTVFAQP